MQAMSGVVTEAVFHGGVMAAIAWVILGLLPTLSRPLNIPSLSVSECMPVQLHIVGNQTKTMNELSVGHDAPPKPAPYWFHIT
jgi:hypothetical protein